MMLPHQRLALETTGAAQACVELLWRENLGVATFMILVPISHYCPNKLLKYSILLRVKQPILVQVELESSYGLLEISHSC